MDINGRKAANEVNLFPGIKHRQKRFPTECKICHGPALYSSYGVVVCDPCRKFFRRNANKNKDEMRCIFSGHCEINLHNRHLCSPCRLAKCFASGMQVEMFRAPRRTLSIQARDQSRQLPTLNLLRTDRSTLTIDQWNLLSNLIHCYDEHSGLALTQQFIEQQNQLPPKMRFKVSSTLEFYQMISAGAQSLYEKNADFISLCSHDRSILLHKTMKYEVGMSSCFTLRQTGILENPNLHQSTQLLYGSNAVMKALHGTNQLDFDITFMKVALALIVFSTHDYIYYTNTPPTNLINMKEVLRIQNMYTELIWRYLLHKYDHKQAVRCFSNFIRAFLSFNNALVEVAEHEQYTNMIESLVKQTKDVLSLTE